MNPTQVMLAGFSIDNILPDKEDNSVEDYLILARKERNIKCMNEFNETFENFSKTKTWLTLTRIRFQDRYTVSLDTYDEDLERYRIGLHQQLLQLNSCDLSFLTHAIQSGGIITVQTVLNNILKE